MVTHLVTGLTQGFQEIVFPTWSAHTPQPSPTTPKRFFPAPQREKQFFMEFSCQDEPLGRIVIKVLQGAGVIGQEFESLVTGRNGFGYKGSRVYACCKGEWCLLGDLLYQNPCRTVSTDWDPRLPEGRTEVEDEGGGGGGGTPALRKLYRGGSRGIRVPVDTGYPDTRGAVVSVTSDYDADTGSWIFGPQIKLCLSDSLLKSGRVLGVLTEGMEVAQRLSQMGGNVYELQGRITISNCGAVEARTP